MRSRGTPWLCASALKSTFSTSAWMMCSSPAVAARACKAGIRSVSSSIAVSLPAAASSGRVSAPSPGPISTTKSSARGATALTMRST